MSLASAQSVVRDVASELIRIPHPTFTKVVDDIVAVAVRVFRFAQVVLIEWRGTDHVYSFAFDCKVIHVPVSYAPVSPCEQDTGVCDIFLTLRASDGLLEGLAPVVRANAADVLGRGPSQGNPECLLTTGQPESDIKDASAVQLL